MIIIAIAIILNVSCIVIMKLVHSLVKLGALRTFCS